MFLNTKSPQQKVRKIIKSMINVGEDNGVGSGLHLELFPIFLGLCMTPTHSQAGFMISLSWTIALFKLSCQYLRQEPRRPEELVSRQLLKPLNGGRCLGMPEFKPTKHFPDTWGFVRMPWKMVLFPLTQSILLLGRPRSLTIPSPSSLYSLGKNSGACFHSTFCSNPLGSC